MYLVLRSRAHPINRESYDACTVSGTYSILSRNAEGLGCQCPSLLVLFHMVLGREALQGHKRPTHLVLDAHVITVLLSVHTARKYFSVVLVV